MPAANSEHLKPENKGMKKLVFNFWIVNALTGISLFIIYRFAISKTETDDESFFKWFLALLEILLSLGFSLVFLIGMLISSLLLFLNLFEKIRNNLYLSMLTFLGIPVAFIIWIFCMISDLSGDHSINFITTFLLFSLIYLIFNLIQFLIFRKKISTTLPDLASRRNKL